MLSAVLFLALSAHTSFAETSKGTIVVLAYNTSLDIFANAKDDAIAAGKALGYGVVYDGTPEVDTNGLVGMIQSYSEQDIDAICIASGDAASVVPAAQAAMAKGIKVVSWDLDINKEGRQAYAGCMDLSLMGVPQVQTMIDCIGEEGQWAIVTSLLTNKILNDRIEIMKQYVSENYPKLELLTVETNDGDPTKTYDVALNILTTYPEVDAIMSNISSGMNPIAKAIEFQGLKGQVWAVGQSTANLARFPLESGIAKSAFLWDTGRWASWAVTVAAALVEGTEVPNGEGIALGEFTDAIRQDDLWYYNEALFFTPDNIDQYATDQ